MEKTLTLEELQQLKASVDKGVMIHKGRWLEVLETAILNSSDASHWKQMRDQLSLNRQLSGKIESGMQGQSNLYSQAEMNSTGFNLRSVGALFRFMQGGKP